MLHSGWNATTSPGWISSTDPPALHQPLASGHDQDLRPDAYARGARSGLDVTSRRTFSTARRATVVERHRACENWAGPL